MLIINADDWGRSAPETDAALDCFQERRITAASAMVYMRDSDRAARLARANALNVGLHLNFSEPFTDPECPQKLKQHQGRLVKFLKGNKYAQVVYNPFLVRAFANSFRGQWNEFLRLYGKAPAHIDGHHHMHLCANLVFSRLVPCGIRMRRNFSFCPGEKNWLNRKYRQMIDRWLSRKYILTDYFFDLTTSLEQDKLDRVLRLSRSSSVELMTHPVSHREADYLMSAEFCGILQQLGVRQVVLA